MLGAILAFLGGPVINGAIAAYRERLKATNTQDAMALDLLQKEIEAEIAARAEATKLLLAEQGHWYTAMIRPLFAMPFIIFAWKIVVWDKVLHLGTTDPLDANFWNVFLTIILAYFGGVTVERVSRIFKR